jgi:broad specificity phosphatase PhoE
MSSPDLLRLILVRHGEAVGNADGLFIGARDDDLTSRGEQQARTLAELLRLYKADAIYTSPLRRAFRTAELIGQALGLRPVIDQRAREQHFGALEGQPVPGWGSAAAAESARKPFSTQAPPGGEPFSDVVSRLSAFVADLDSIHRQGRIVLVSHVGPIKALLYSVLGLPLETASGFFLDPGTMSVVDWRPRRLVRSVNIPGDHESLRWL